MLMDIMKCYINDDVHMANCPTNTLNNPGGLPSISGSMYVRARASSSLSLRNNNWIEQVFKRRECAKFIPSSKYPNKCGCGRLKHLHSAEAIQQHQSSKTDANNHLTVPYNERRLQKSDEDQEMEMTGADSEAGPNNGRRTVRSLSEKWTIRKHTTVLPTDSYGTIEFQGGPHPYKAQYLRLNVETDPADIMYLFENIWQMPPPKLIITVHGGITNFDLQPKLARVFRKGLLKAAKTTGAWIITSGINAGVVRHVAAALEGCGTLRSKIDTVVPYHPHSFSPKGRFAVLNNRHSYFLLVDNGTVGRYVLYDFAIFSLKKLLSYSNYISKLFIISRLMFQRQAKLVDKYGADIILRKRLEM
ncbi:unnamed protein product, partial [Anisakis simplex]|uniref:LSDAT_euk domain-containing protein n=1 Tax=Anisakis simplex TaxID=6269 RepID=A0A0M3KEA2_ANISI